jgi:hypothetical protein
MPKDRAFQQLCDLRPGDPAARTVGYQPGDFIVLVEMRDNEVDIATS